MEQNQLKQLAALKALDYVEDNTIIGVGTGSTVNYFIDALAEIKHRIDATVTSSIATEERLKALGVPVIELTSAHEVALYVDGADEINAHKEMIKGGGGALTREKIVATVAKQFICIVDESKSVKQLGKFPLAVEVLPMARSYVARQLVILGGNPEYREGFVTDNGNIILDVYGLNLAQPQQMEQTIKQLTGVVDNGLFSKRTADIVLTATTKGQVTCG